MEIRHLLQAHCLFILIRFISAQSEVTIENENIIYALPGSDVNLTCTILKEKGIHITQTQWSKTMGGGSEKLAVYNPLYGTTYLNSLDVAYHYSASFMETVHHDQSDSSRPSCQRHSNAECNQWILQLRNASLERTGVYECSFATFPAGIKSSEIHLIIKKDDEKTSEMVEILLNQTLEIPCFKDIPSVNLENAPLTWLMKEDGTEEILITKQYYYQPSYITSHAIYKERIQMDPENTLKISPVLVVDNGKKFICSVAERSGRTMKSITEVKVFVKPEISTAIYSSSTEKGILTCVVKKAFPKPDLLWYVDGMILNDKSEGIFVENEDTKDADGFYELRSQLTIGSTTQPSIHQTFKCMSLYPFPGNETRNVSSEEIVLPFAGFPTTSSPSFKLTSQVNSPVSDFPTEQYQGTSSPSLESVSQAAPVSDSSTEKFQASSSPSLEFTSQVAPVSDSPTERFQMVSSTSLEVITQVIPVSKSPTEKPLHSPKNLHDKASSTTLSGYSAAPQSSPTTGRVMDIITLTSRGNSSTVKGLVNLTGHTKFSWPVVVSSMLLICTFLIILGIRKWCRYQKEIMNRPPSFKPPPPPIKYTPIHDTDGTYPSCHELENL